MIGRSDYFLLWSISVRCSTSELSWLHLVEWDKCVPCILSYKTKMAPVSLKMNFGQLVCRLGIKKEETHLKWSFNCDFLFFNQVAEIRCKKVCTSKSDLRTNDFSIVGSLPRDFELSNFDCYGKAIDTGAGKSQSKNNKKPPPPKPVIPTAAKRVDLYARALFPFSFLFFNVIYWSVYLWLSWDYIINLPTDF